MESNEMSEFATNRSEIPTDKVNYAGNEFIPEDEESMFDEDGDYYGEDYDESFLNDEDENNSNSENIISDNLQKNGSFSNDSGKESEIKESGLRNYDSTGNQSVLTYVGEKYYKSGENESFAAKFSTDITNQGVGFERDQQNGLKDTMQSKDYHQNLQSKASDKSDTDYVYNDDNEGMDTEKSNQLSEENKQNRSKDTDTMMDKSVLHKDGNGYVQENDYSDKVMPEYTSENDNKELTEFNENQADEFDGGAEEEENEDNFQDFSVDNSGSNFSGDPEGYADDMTDAGLPMNDGEEFENEEPSEEEEERDESDEDFNEAINALGDLDNEDLINEGEFGEENIEEDSFENPDDTTNNDQESFPSTSEGVTGESKEDQPKKKRKRKKKGEVADEDGKKPKRKRKKKGEKSEDGEKKKADKNARRNIRKILTESNLEKETLDAQNAELERQRRLADLKKVLPTQAAIRPSPEKDTTKEKDSQLKSLLQAAEETAEKETEKKEEDIKIKEEKGEAKIKKDGNIIDISSGEDDEDCVMVQSEEEEEDEDMSDEDHAEAEDMNNSGSHINDMYNIPDKEGRVLVNVGHPTSDPDIYLSSLIARNIKPHQIGGVRFLYDNLVECINRFKTSSGFGCILAHSMGLGKTIQMIGFIDIFLRHTGARTVLVIVPINTLANWMAEFNMWVPDEQTCKQNAANLPPDLVPRPYPIYLLNDTFKNTPARAMVVESWAKSGGVLLIGYEMYRLLSSKKVHLQKTKGRKRNHESIIDVEEEDRDKKLLIDVHEALVNPGPDLVVCDEGHRIKNSHAGISQSLKQIKTKRRIVLTGYPLQNNLIEYWCMVDFVRPNFLGTKTEFCNMFERPIMNGQCADSTPQDVRLMRYRAHVLHSLLEGFVQRRGHTVLQAALPPKQEYVFMIRMSPIQKQLYHKFMESITESGQNGWVNNNPLKAFSVCCKIWNHPDILYTILKKSLDDNDLDIETGEPKKKGRGRAKKETPPATPAPPSNESDASNSGSSQGPLPPGIPSIVSNPGPTMSLGKPYEPNITYDWANEIMKDYVPGLLENGGKMVMLFKIVQESLAVGDKILVFSQSLFTLNLVEEFLSKQKVPRYDTDEFWCKNKNYFRLDGSTSSTEREKLINQFNVDSTTWLFLLSTRAGSLGVNLVGANRVVVLDASWNPCHDCQAICRVYRFGQCKPSFIYRFVTENTMERKIYDRQVNKQGMSDRVVDELNPQNQFKRDHVEKLMFYEDKSFDVQDFSGVDEEFYDPVMISTLKDQGHWLTSRPFTHESLLIDRKELKLTMKEKRLAKQSYVMEKRLNVSYSRPSYAAYYPKGQQPYQGMIRGRGMPARPIASVKPIVSTPVPMKPKIVAAPQILKPGVSVHQVLTTTDITLPGTNTTTEAGVSGPKKIPAGQQVLVIRTPKGVYIRTPDGKIFAVRSKPQPDSTSPLDTLANTGSTLANTVTSGGATTVTVVRAATSVSTASSTSIRTPVTVIRPGSGISSNKPLTIIRQGPGPIRTVIPVSIGSKSGGAANATATAQLMSQKVSTMIKNGAQIKIVNPNLLAGGKAGTTSAATGSKKIIANTLSFSGGNVVSTTTASKPIASVKTVKNEESSSENTMETDQDKKSDNDTKKKDSDSLWNLPPIDMQALKIPKQLNESNFQRNEQDKSGKSSSAVKPMNSSKPSFSLSQTSISDTKTPLVLPVKKDMEPAKLSTRPSDIDLHELQLASNPVTTNNSQMSESLNSNSSQSTIFTSNNSFMSSDPSYTGAGNQQAMVPQQNNMMSQQMQGFASDNMMSNNMASQQMSGGMMNSGQSSNTGMYSQNQTGFGHGSVSDYPGNQSNFNNMSSFSGMNQYGGNNVGNQNFGYNSGMTGTSAQQHGYDGSPTDLNSDFNGIHNNSSFLSELNFSETDDNFLSQLSGANDTVQNQGNQMRNDSQGSNMFMNSQNFGGGGAGSMGMQGYQPSQQQNMNYDMFNSSQQNPNFFPKFGNNQFPVNNSFGGNQSFSQQGGYPSGSMYPMGGMMQPTMYGYPPFAPYPYAPMMPPMPYYPMPFQPQYGVGSSNMGNSNMGNSNMGNSNMGNSNMSNPNMGNSGMGSQGGGFNMSMAQGDHSFQQNQTNPERTSN